MTTIIDQYHQTVLTTEIDIDTIFSVHYFKYSKNYIFEGEKHNFWEFLYVDKGAINVMADDRKLILNQGEMIFHKPNEWHNVVANSKVAPNIIVISFTTKSSAMLHFENKVVTIDNQIKYYLGEIVSEARNAFESELSDPKLKSLKKRRHVKFGSEQLIKLYLKLLLIEMIREEKKIQSLTRTFPTLRDCGQEEKVKTIINLLKEHTHKSLTINDICKKTLLSRSSLQKLFKESMDISVMAYFKRLKINESKILIRQNQYNFTQIAGFLGYNSIHYFSRTFKSVTGMTLSDYAKSVNHLKDDQPSR